MNLSIFNSTHNHNNTKFSMIHVVCPNTKSTKEIHYEIQGNMGTSIETNISLEDLKNKGFDQNIISSIDSLSRRRSESYIEYIERLMQNKISVKIKLLDLADNIKMHSENNDNGIYDAKIIQYKNALKQIRSK